MKSNLTAKFQWTSTLLSALLVGPASAGADHSSGEGAGSGRFVIEDIRVQGLRRLSPGTVFNALPVKVGDEFDESLSGDAIRALFKTGLFRDVRIERDDDVLIVIISERETLSQISITGNSDIKTEDLLTALKQIGFVEGEVFDRSVLDRAEQELRRQYFSQGKYGVEIKSLVESLGSNRVAVGITIKEGRAAKIKSINVVGNKAYSDDELVKQFELTTPTLISFFTKSDQYSKQKLAGDLETLRSYYLDRGYINFSIDSTQIAITPDKSEIYITINVTEGDRYTLARVKLAGDLIVPADELFPLVTTRRGDIFSRKAVTQTSTNLSDRLGDEGYAFANVNPVPEIDNTSKTVALTYFIDPGKRAYVRRLNFAGNTKTRDEVLRREMRQLEGGWFSTSKVNRSIVQDNFLGSGNRKPQARRLRFVFYLSLILGLPAQGLAASGDLDPSLDGDGRALTDFGGFDRAFAMITQPDGKVVAAGASSTGVTDDFALARYNPDGSLDANFGAAGTSLAGFGGGNAQAFALVRQPDGKLVAAGTSTGLPGIRFALARFTTGGTLDTSFGFSGSVHDDLGGNAVARALVVQRDGKLVAAGFFFFSSVSSVDFALARYNSDGVLDASFGRGGHAIVSAAGVQQALAIAIQQDDQLVAAGTSAGDFALVRFNESGIPDPNFGPGGIKLIDFGGFDTANAVVVQPDGKLVAAGTSAAGSNGDFALVRFNEDGTPDTTFGFGGRRLVDFGGFDEAKALVLRPGGKLVAAGFSNSNDFDFVVVQFNSDGSLDTSFGSNGVARTSFGSTSEGAFAVTLDTDGKLVAAGTSDASGDLDFALARYVVTEDPLASRRFCNNRPVTMIGTPQSDRLRGTNRDDVILGLGGNDTIRGLRGNDTLCGGAGRDVLIGGPGRDRLLGQGGPDKLFGGAGNDVMNGGAGKNRCNGDQGRDSRRRCEATRATPPEPPRPPQAPSVSIFCNSPLCEPL